MAWDAYNSNVPPASSMVEGPSNLTPNLTSMPNPVGSAINAAKFFAGAAPLTSQIASKYGLTIADQSDLGKAQMDAAQKSKAGPRMAPNPESSSPFQPLPEPPSGKLAQIKAWLRSLTGQNPPLETVAPPAWAPLKEPENVYMPTRSIGEAQGQLESAAQKLSQAKTAAPKPYNGPWANPIWSAEHRPGTGEDPHAYQSDEELVRRLEAENPEMAKLRALKVTDVQKENEEEAITSKAEQTAAANEELRKAGKKVIESPIDTRIDKLAAPKLLDGYQDSINHLQIEHQADVARAKSLGASPDQIRALSVANQTELQVHKDWLTKARALLKAEDYDAYTQHLRRRP